MSVSGGREQSTGKLPMGSLPRSSLPRITDCPEMNCCLTVEVKHQYNTKALFKADLL